MKKSSIYISLAVLSLFLAATVPAGGQNTGQTQFKPALLVIDIQNAFLPMIPEQEKEVAMAGINYYVDLFHKRGFPVIRIYHMNKEYGVVPGSEQFEYPSTVTVSDQDPKIIKTYGDGFNKTGLDSLIKAKGCNTLFLCGLSAVGCVISTWIGAQNHDYKAFMIKDAIMSHKEQYTENIETMFDAVSYDMIMLLVGDTGK
jgi:nicotinamidase-related amidase